MPTVNRRAEPTYALGLLQREQGSAGDPLQGRLLASPGNIRLGWKGMTGANALAYYENS